MFSIAAAAATAAAVVDNFIVSQLASHTERFA